jgi:hypothetical protein
MSAIAEPHYIEINSCSFQRGWAADDLPIWSPPEYYVWRSDVHGRGSLLWFGGSHDAALDFAKASAAADRLLIYDKPPKVPAPFFRGTVQ